MGFHQSAGLQRGHILTDLPKAGLPRQAGVDVAQRQRSVRTIHESEDRLLLLGQMVRVSGHCTDPVVSEAHRHATVGIFDLGVRQVVETASSAILRVPRPHS